MKIIDTIALGRALRILANLIIKLVELFNKPTKIDETMPQPKRKKILPWRNNDK